MFLPRGEEVLPSGEEVLVSREEVLVNGEEVLPRALERPWSLLRAIIISLCGPQLSDGVEMLVLMVSERVQNH